MGEKLVEDLSGFMEQNKNICINMLINKGEQEETIIRMTTKLTEITKNKDGIYLEGENGFICIVKDKEIIQDEFGNYTIISGSLEINFDIA